MSETFRGAAVSMLTDDAPPVVTIDVLLEQFSCLLLDAYGVLINHEGPLPGARELVSRLNCERRSYFIVTNDAARLPRTAAIRLAGMGLDVPEERIITSGSLIETYFAQQGLAGAHCVVLGTEDSREYVRRAGGAPVAPMHDEASVIVVCDEDGYPMIEQLDGTVTLLFRRVDAGLPVHLLLPNPDLVYPKGQRTFGITAGSVAALIEAALDQRYPWRDDLSFKRLGKPERPMFEEAVRRAGTSDLVMVGDQLGTDIKGALDFGIPAALVAGGLDRYAGGSVRPTFLLAPLGGIYAAGPADGHRSF